MKVAASVLDCNDRVKGVLSLNMTNISYVHIDVMDGIFVPSVQFDDISEISEINLVTKYPMDVHLMVNNPEDYIKDLDNMNIEFITIHLEIAKDKNEIFNQIRDLGYKVGLSIKPNTSVSDIEAYLDDIDLVLVMSVEPGLGGQKFIDITVDKIRELKEVIGKRNILIEVDGGINNDTITKLKDVDIAVVGSYITKSDNYYKRVEELLNNNKISKRKKLYKILLGIGILPFVLLGVIALYSSIFGFTFFFSTVYGIEAFLSIIALFGLFFWYVLLIGLILVIVGIVGLLKLKRLSRK